MNTAPAIFHRIASDATTAGELDTYEDLPAIFDDTAPDDYVFGQDMAVIIAAPTRNDPAPTFTEQSWVVVRDVRLYCRHTGDNSRLDDLADRLRALFHLKQDQLSVDGGTVTACTVTGPVAAPTTDPALVGRRITLRLELQEL